MRKIILVLFVCSLVWACASAKRSYMSEPAAATFSNESFDVSLKPVFRDGRSNPAAHVKSFKLTIVNKTDKPIELVWDRTSYLQGDARRGGFTHHGIPYKDKDLSRSPTEIAPGSTFSRSIFPSVLIQYTGPYSDWELPDMKPGQHGAMVTIRVGERETCAKLAVTIKEM